MYGFDPDIMHQLIDEELDDVEAPVELDEHDPLWALIQSTDLDSEFDEVFEPQRIASVTNTIKVKKTIGHTCTGCKEPYPYSESNQDDGTFKCWGCRNY